MTLGISVRLVKGTVILEKYLINLPENCNYQTDLRSVVIKDGRGHSRIVRFCFSIILNPFRPIWRLNNSVSVGISSYFFSPTNNLCFCRGESGIEMANVIVANGTADKYIIFIDENKDVYIV